MNFKKVYFDVMMELHQKECELHQMIHNCTKKKIIAPNQVRIAPKSIRIAHPSVKWKLTANHVHRSLIEKPLAK